MFAMDHSNVSFVSLGDGLVASTRQVAFDGATCLSCDSSRILSGGACVAAGEVMAKVQDGDPGWVRVCGLQGMVLPERDGVCRMHCTPRDVQPQRRRRVVRRTARLALFDDNADHTRRATQPAARRGGRRRAGRQRPRQRRHCQAHVGFDVVDRCVLKLPDTEDWRRCAVVLGVHRRRDRSSRLCLLPRREGYSFGLIRIF